MMMTAETFTSLLQSLGLVQGSFKPAPNVAVTSNATITSIHYAGSFHDADAALEGAQLFHEQQNATRPMTLHSSLGVVNDHSAAKNSRCTVTPYDPPPIADQVFRPFDSSMANVYRYRRQQSVNLGSWFVQENWMVPSIFSCASGPQAAEIDVASGWGSIDNARAVLERHWDTFINQTDFDYLASIGINTVRLPIGYWTLGPSFVTGTPFERFASVYRDSWVRLLRAINIASQSGIGVLVDLHGAPGSQNGQSHSGISDGQTNMFSDPGNVNKIIGVLTFLAQQLYNITNVVGIQLLNEPVNVNELPDFYSQVITAMRAQFSPGSTFPLYIHDGFDLERFSDFIANRTDFIVEDHHSYFVFTPQDDSEPANQHTGDVEGPIAGELGAASSEERGNLVIDEWSCALTDESLSTQKDPTGARRQFCTGQMNVYANVSAGWGFWSYYKEGCETDQGWCFKSAVGNSLPSTFFSYGKPPPTDPAALQIAYTTVASMAVPPDSEVLTKVGNSTSSQATPSSAQSNDWQRRDGSDTYPTLAQQSSLRGYSDGFLTAKIFAQNGWSKLGFTGQYIEDSLRAVEPSITPGTQDNYRSAFRMGLADGEDGVEAVLA